VSRIVAGSRGGRRIAMPPGAGTRPTTDRVREALFSALAAWAGTAAVAPETALADLAFCDLYAGSGAVGLEAASRGAGPVLLVESDRRTAQLIRRNAADLTLTVQISTSRVEHLLAQPAETAYDIVFADPPYERDSATVTGELALIVQHRWVSPTGLIVVERSRRTPAVVWPGAVTSSWSRAYGETVLFFGSLDNEV
jgi:16S rRNA (guanine966-N2)-methyltransferase